MNTQFKKGILEMRTLSIIKDKDMYDFEVIENTVYPVLRRLPGQCFFETYIEHSKIGAPRKYYQITKLGIKKCQDYETEWKKFLQGVFKLLG